LDLPRGLSDQEGPGVVTNWSTRSFLLTIYDTIFAFGTGRWRRVDWARVFAPGEPRKNAEKSLERLDRFCTKWEIELQKWSADEVSPNDPAKTRPVTFRRFTHASKHRVDHLLGPVVQEHDPGDEDVLRPLLVSASTRIQDSSGGLLRNSTLG